MLKPISIVPDAQEEQVSSGFCYWYLVLVLWLSSFGLCDGLFFIFSGNTGVAVMLYDPRRSNISKIEKESGVKFEHVSAPQANDIAKAVGRETAEMINQVSDRYDSLFAYCV
jgi:hypothetical protein